MLLLQQQQYVGRKISDNPTSLAGTSSNPPDGSHFPLLKRSTMMSVSNYRNTAAAGGG
jgi:hypothetical protein